MIVWMTLMAGNALANDEDKAACEGLAQDAECVDHNDRDGRCVPDDSEPNVLTCESLEDLPQEDSGQLDDSGRPLDDSVSCRHGGPGLPGGALVALSLLGLRRRRR